MADNYFRYRYIHRFIFLETVAAVPGMVGGLLQHLKCLRLMVCLAQMQAGRHSLFVPCCCIAP